MSDRVPLWRNPTDSPGGPYTWRIEKHPVLGELLTATCERGHESWLTTKKHSIADDGAVSPSYVCPIDGCGWHVYVRLDGWTGGVFG